MAEKMTRCPQGHFYDPAKHKSCPWCALPEDSGPPPLPPPLPSAVAKIDPVVGWLVCVAGPDRGRDFRLRAEKNFVGRAPAMDVCLAGDAAVSLDRHAVIIFDPKKQTFWALPGESAGLVYLNGDAVYGPAQMRRDDVLEVGLTKLVLIPFCGEKYSWPAQTATVSLG